MGNFLRCPVVAILILFSWTPTSAVAQVQAKEVDGKFPTGSLSKLGSGSGVVIGKRLVLTNRHVVQDDDNKIYDGFRVYSGPDYTRDPKSGRVKYICPQYDLALIELSDDMHSDGMIILDGIPALATKVRAYGFPLGSQFGVALTATGGQISRQPIATDLNDRSEEADIKRSMWHDAVISSGSSGGPLFSDDGALLGLNYASLRRDSKHAFAVPGKAIADFLRGARAQGVEFVTSLGKGVRDAEKSAVYIEILSAGAKAAVTDKNLRRSELLASVKANLTRINDSRLAAVASGDYKQALNAVPASSIKDGEIARIAARMSVIQISEDGILVELDGVRCMILLPNGNGGELSARLGNDVRGAFPHDGIYLIGKAQPYTTVIGKTAYYIPLLPIAGLIKSDEIEEIKKRADEEQSRRLEANKRALEEGLKEQARALEEKQKEDARRAAEMEAKALDRYLTLLRHRFSDSSGRFSIDAVIVSSADGNVTLIRMADKTRLVIPIAKLSDSDVDWIEQNKTWIKLYGEKLSAHLLGK